MCCHTRLHLGFQQSWKSCKFQLARWSLREAGLCREPHPAQPPTHPPSNLLHYTLGLGCLRKVWKMSGRCPEVVWKASAHFMSVPTFYVCPHLLCLSPHFMSVPIYYVCPIVYVCLHLLYPSSLLCLSPPFMSVPTYFVCPHLYVCPHVLYPSSPIMSVPNHHFNCLQALLKSWSFGECQSASGMFLNGIWTRCVRFNGFFKSQKRSLPKKCFRIHTRLHLGFSAKLKIWQAPGCKMEPQSGIITCNIPTHPPAK